MKTLQQVKEHVAYKSDYPDWNALVNEMAGDIEVMEFYLDIIARQYAKCIYKQILKKAASEQSHNEVKHRILSTKINLL